MPNKSAARTVRGTFDTNTSTSLAYFKRETRGQVTRFIHGIYLGESSGGVYSFGESVPYVPVKTGMALDMLGDVEAFENFHAHPGKETFADDIPMRTRTDETEMLAIARAALDGLNPADVKSLPKPDRNHNLRALKATTLTLSQIALITGISRSTICRA